MTESPAATDRPPGPIDDFARREAMAVEALGARFHHLRQFRDSRTNRWLERRGRGFEISVPVPRAPVPGEDPERRRLADLAEHQALLDADRRGLARRPVFQVWRLQRGVRAAFAAGRRALGRFLASMLQRVFAAGSAAWARAVLGPGLAVGAWRSKRRAETRRDTTPAPLGPASVLDGVVPDLAAATDSKSARTVSAAVSAAVVLGDLPRRPRVLLVMPYSIWPPEHGGAVRLWQQLRHLGGVADLHVVVFHPEGRDPAQRRALERHGRSVTFLRWQPAFERRPWSLVPPNVRLFDSRQALQALRDLVERHQIDLVQLEYTELASYVEPLQSVGGRRVPVILVEHDLAFRSYARRRQLGFARRFVGSDVYGRGRFDGLKLRRYELAACRRADQVHVMSEADGHELAATLGESPRDGRIRVVPNAVDVDGYRPPGDAVAAEPRRHLLFVGNFQNLPNRDALEWFLETIWPRIYARRREIGQPGLLCRIVGAGMPERYQSFASIAGVEIVGRVETMAPEYHRHAVLVVPLRAGSGTRLKLLEAFAAGIPAVSTPLGAEGLQVRDGEHLLLAREPEAFAAACLRVLGDAEFGAGLASAARELVARRYDWSTSAAACAAGWRALLDPARIDPGEGGTESVSASSETDPIDVSIIIPTLDGGELLERTLSQIAAQETRREVEVVVVDSGSRAEDLDRMRQHGVRLHGIDRRTFDHGLTRDLGASLARGRVLVFLNQDAMPTDPQWLERLTSPFDREDPPEAVQGGQRELPHDSPLVRRFFWDSCGGRFYFTRESRDWIERYEGLGFSTVNAAIRRDAWERLPFGRAAIMEDKKWQRAATDAGWRIETVDEAAVHHTHDYDLRSLSRRCRSEGHGWSLLGEPYRLRDMLADMARFDVHLELLRGLRSSRRLRPAEIVFPWLRPLMLWVGSRWSRDVSH